MLLKALQNIWGDFVASGTSDMFLGFDWQANTRAKKAYVRLDKDELLALEFELETLTTVLAKIAENTHTDLTKKCLMVWETLINVGTN